MTTPFKPTFADIVIGLTGLTIAAAGVWILLAGPSGPMPVNYGWSGRVNGWGTRVDVGAAIAGSGLVLTVLGVGFGMAAARSPDPARQRALRAGQRVSVLAILGVALFLGGTSLNGVTTLGGGLPMAGLSLILALIGAFLGRVGPNPFVGLRTPWTYKSRLAWDRSNRLAGRLLFLLGVSGVAASFIAPEPAGLVVLLGGVIAAVVWSVIESWRVWRTDPDRQPF